MLKDKVHNHFYIRYDRSKVADGIKQAYIQGADDCLNYLQNEAWHILTDDVDESYPPCFEYVLVQDEYGDKYVACCDANLEWSISNGERSMKLDSEIVKWIEIN